LASETGSHVTASSSRESANHRSLSGGPPNWISPVAPILPAKPSRQSLEVVPPPVELAVDINDVVADVLSFTRGELPAKAVSVRLMLFEGLPTVIGDRMQLQQVLLNLVMNAIEAMSSITDRERVLAIISQRGDDGSPIVTVENSGLGLDPANGDRIFVPFFTTKPSGMGMGLSISTSIVEAHGGFLWASPNWPRGAAFHLKLPIGRGTKPHSDKAELVSADLAARPPAQTGSTGICGGTQP
jgi:signal transduction histidine kinase